LVSIFYSNAGIAELRESFPNAYIFVVGEPDNLTDDGLLVPGVGLLDERIRE
jgi:uracil phosphoribosyltransferase